MAKKNQVFIDVVVDDKGTTKRVAVNAKKLGLELDKAGVASDKTTKNTEKLNKSNKDLDRNLRGTAKMTSNSTKEFSKMQQGMGGLVGAYATLAAQVFAVSAAFQFLQVASDFRNLIAGQEALGATTGVAYKSITENIIAATDAQIQYGEAARAAAIGTAAGLTSNQLTELGNAAKNASFALGRDLTDSFNRLVRGVTKAEPELLDELGIILRLETATEKYAAELGKARTELNAFERTQAVTNDVLEQAERKFGAIEAMMDPSAAALQQFTKSFDDLIKTFQVGVITGLTPILSFLTQNTTALVATLGLISLPILRAILPSMAAWKQSSIDAAEESRKLTAQYLADVDKQTAALANSQKARQTIADKAAKQARKTLLDQGTTAAPGSGLSYLQGDEGGSQGGAARILKNARKQIEQQGEITTGALKGYNDQQLTDFEKSYAARSAVASKTTQRITGFWATAGAQIKRGWAGLGVAWNVVMGKVATAAAITAGVVNAVFTVAGVIGAISLIVTGTIALTRALIPANEEAERQKKVIEELTDKYKLLNEELVRARLARRDLLIGTQVTSNVGNALQSIDVPNFLQDVTALRNLDENSKGYDKLAKKVKSTAAELALIDPRFRSLYEQIKQGNLRITPAQVKGFQQISNELINTGQEVDSLADKFTQFDKSFAALTSGLVKFSPIQVLIKDTEALIETLETSLVEIDKVMTGQTQEYNNRTAAAKEQEKIDREFFKNSRARNQSYFKFSQKTFEEQAKQRKKLGIEQVPGLFKKEDITLQAENFAASRKQGAGFLKQLNEQRAILATIFKFEEKRVKSQETLKRLTTEATASLNQGLTIQGKIDNLKQEELNIESKLEKARQVTRDAELAVELAKEQGKSKKEVGIQQDLLKIAQEREKLAQRQAQISLLNLGNKELELQREKELLAVKLRVVQAENAIALARLQQERDNAGLGAGGFQDAVARRQSEINILDQVKNRAADALTLAQSAFDEEVARLQRAELDRLTGGNIANATNADIANAEATGLSEAQAGGFQTSLDRAKQEVEQAQLNLDLETNKGTVLANNNMKKIESLVYEREAVALGREAKVFAQLYKEQREAGVPVEKINVELLKQQAKSMNDLATSTERRQGIFDQIEQGFEGAFTSIIDGTKSAKDAFGDMAKGILKHLAKVIAEMMVAKILSSSLFSSFGFGGGGTTPPISAAMGGVVSMDKKKQYAGGGYTSPLRNYSRGGMARGPQQGYNAVLHGNEAVVPLPDNRHIPVELSGGMGQQNNVTVNVNMDNTGGTQTSSQSNGPTAERMGAMIARAVQDELQNQKRSGGILSPYGAA